MSEAQTNQWLRVMAKRARQDALNLGAASTPEIDEATERLAAALEARAAELEAEAHG